MVEHSGMSSNIVSPSASGRWWAQPQWWVLLAIAGFILYFGAFNIFRHLNLFSAQYDLGNMDQVLWQSVHGRWFSMVDPQTAMLTSRAAVHTDFLLLAYLPFYALWHHPLIMVVLQVVAVASGAWPLFRFANRHLSARAAALFAIAYLAYPAMHWAVTFDVHAVVLATPLFLWLAWVAAERRWWWFAAFAAAILLSKEETGATLALFGLYVAWWRRPRWIGFTTFAVGVLWTALMLFVVIPHGRQASGHFALGYYQEFGDSMGEVAKNILLRPLDVLRHLFDADGRHYQLLLLFPLGFLPLVGLPLLIVATPELVVNLLSTNHGQQTIFFQYTSVITPFVFLAAVAGWHRLHRWFGSRPLLLRLAAVVFILANVVSVYRWGLLPLTRQHGDVLNAFRPSPYQREVQNLAKSITTERRVAATNNLAPHFTQRDWAWAFPHRIDLADDLVILTGGDFEVVPMTEIERTVADLERDPRWELVYHRDRLYHFRRVTLTGE